MRCQLWWGADNTANSSTVTEKFKTNTATIKAGPRRGQQPPPSLSTTRPKNSNHHRHRHKPTKNTNDDDDDNGNGNGNDNDNDNDNDGDGDGDGDDNNDVISDQHPSNQRRHRSSHNPRTSFAISNSSNASCKTTKQTTEHQTTERSSAQPNGAQIKRSNNVDQPTKTNQPSPLTTSGGSDQFVQSVTTAALIDLYIQDCTVSPITQRPFSHKVQFNAESHM